MLLWFAGLSIVGVWAVFRDPALDHRLVVAGALLPDALQLAGVEYLHSVVVWACVLVVVMLSTRQRRKLRRRLLAVPIGGFAHLVLDATWARTSTFWWPLLGVDLPGHGLASLGRPALVVAVQEFAGLVALVWCWRHFGLHEPGPRGAFLSGGRLAERTGS